MEVLLSVGGNLVFTLEVFLPLYQLSPITLVSHGSTNSLLYELIVYQ